MNHQVISRMARYRDGAAGSARRCIDGTHIRTHQADSALGFMDGGDAIFAECFNGVRIGALNLAYDRWFHCSSAFERVELGINEYSVGPEDCQADFGRWTCVNQSCQCYGWTMSIQVITAIPGEDSADIESLLREVYVHGGFTESVTGDSMFAASAVFNRGHVLIARDLETQKPAGM